MERFLFQALCQRAAAEVLQAQSVDNDDSAQLSALLQASDDDDFLAQSAPEAKAYAGPTLWRALAPTHLSS